MTPLSQAVHGLTARGEELLGLIDGPDPRVVRVDPSTGEVTDELPLVVLPFAPFGLDRTPDGNLWFLASFLPGPTASDLFRIAPDGTVENLHSFFPAFGGLAIAPPTGHCVSGPALQIPAASPLGLAAFALLLAAGGALLLEGWRRPRTGDPGRPTTK